MAGSWQAPAVAAIACLVLAATWSLWFPSPAPLPRTAATGNTGPRPASAAIGPTPSTPVSEPQQSLLTQAGGATRPGLPRLILPGIDVTADLDPAEVVDNQLILPEDPARAGYWIDGAAPNDATGTVLVSGHVKSGDMPGALWALASSSPGDPVVLRWVDGTASQWVVSATSSRPRTADTTDLFTRQGPHRLVVVTCGGPQQDGHYRDLVTVVALPA